jgi:hypothetical protein
MKKRSLSLQSNTLTTAATRKPLAERLKQRMLKQYFVRAHMGLILSATTASGLLASKVLLVAGLHSVLIRYPLSVLAAYALFVSMTRLWIRYTVVNRPSRFSLGDDLADAALDVVDGGTGGSYSDSRPAVFSGGDSGGGGASDSWDAPRNAGPVHSSVSSSSSSSGGGVGLDIDLDEGIWILLALAAVILAIFGAGAYLIWAAPEILPEIAVGALLASSLKRSAQQAEARGWLRSVVSCTAIPFGIVFVLVCVLAYAVHHTCPGAPRMIDALRCADRSN